MSTGNTGMPSQTPSVRQRTHPQQRRRGTASVRRAIYEARECLEEQEHTQEVEVPTFSETEVAHVTVEGGITRNMGDFNSARVGVTLTLPCMPEMSEVERAYALASEWVSWKCQEQLDLAIGERGADGPGPQPQQEPEQGQGIERQQSAGIRRQLQT